ncbi:hypothetical protein TNCV_4857871 [Trichonephila clavipes]|nr:hypothetical protein TNCV_4857871 [Trichonephila clavipes]
MTLEDKEADRYHPETPVRAEKSPLETSKRTDPVGKNGSNPSIEVPGGIMGRSPNIGLGMTLRDKASSDHQQALCDPSECLQVSDRGFFCHGSANTKHRNEGSDVRKSLPAGYWCVDDRLAQWCHSKRP